MFNRSYIDVYISDIVTLYELIERSAATALNMQQEDGSMPSGHNGPYRTSETPVRNTSHWLVTFAKAYEITKREVFRAATHRAATYLCSQEARPMGASFWHRTAPELDSCNGLIGQAWTIEALAVATRVLEDTRFAEVAEEVFRLHPFNEDVALWVTVNADGTNGGYDDTFNHQLWFAAAGGLLAPYAVETVNARVVRFLDRMEQRIRLHLSGLIRHLLIPDYSWKRVVVARIKRARRMIYSLWNGDLGRFRRKEEGYHAFNLYALGLLKMQYPDHSFWKSRAFSKLWKYACSPNFKEAVEKSRYGYPYNPSGFEVAFAYEVFGTDDAPITDVRVIQRDWIGKQLAYGYDFERHLMCRNTEDPDTHAARFYEVTRLPDVDLGKEKFIIADQDFPVVP